jgi:exodeoxyribonuclease V gamma subunit
MLHILQGDILHARNRGDSENSKMGNLDHDGSIQIHVCHSPLREMEVLYDPLLERFEQDRTLKPRDILVMTPNIEKYGPFIEAGIASAGKLISEENSDSPHRSCHRRKRAKGYLSTG